MNKQELLHYGIKGMKWGVRRKRDSKTGRVQSQDSKTVAALRKKHVSELSNDEIKKVNERLNLERQMSSLSKKELSPAAKFVTNWAKNFATQQMNALAKQGAQQLADMLGLKLNNEEDD